MNCGKGSCAFACACAIDSVSSFFAVVVFVSLLFIELWQHLTKHYMIWLIEECFSQPARIFNYALGIWEFTILPLEILIGIAIRKSFCKDLIAIIAFLLSKLNIKLANQHFERNEKQALLSVAIDVYVPRTVRFELARFHSWFQIESLLSRVICLFFSFIFISMQNCLPFYSIRLRSMKGAKLHHTFDNFQCKWFNEFVIWKKNHVAVSIRDIKILERNHLRMIARGEKEFATATAMLMYI